MGELKIEFKNIVTQTSNTEKGMNPASALVTKIGLYGENIIFHYDTDEKLPHMNRITKTFSAKYSNASVKRKRFDDLTTQGCHTKDGGAK